ncbi:unnamed protein product, partial [Staurois parvus]
SFTGHPVFLATASSVWAPSCDSRVLIEHGPVVFWELSHVLQDYGEGGGRTNSTSDCKGDHSGSGSGYLSISGTRSPKLPKAVNP